MITKLKRNIALDQLCSSILSKSKYIHFVSIINKNGRLIEYKSNNDNYVLNMNEQELEMLFMQRTLQISLGRETDQKFGKINYMLTQRNDVFEFAFPFTFGVLFIISNPLILSSVINDITSLLDDFTRMQ